MKITYPSYFHQFRCIAADCPDSCCKEWDVQVDAQAAAAYRAVPGPLGDRLRQVLHFEDDGSATMTIENGRCPMWRQDGLCRIQAELGEDALCRVCREFPRLTHDYGDRIEYGLELSCPEAARFILSDRLFRTDCLECSGGEAPECDTDALSVLLRTREYALSLLRDPRRSIPEALGLLLLYGYQAQDELDGAEAVEFDPEASLRILREFGAAGRCGPMVQFFEELEILTPQWKQLLSTPCPTPWQPEHRAMAGYLVRRYWLQAVSDYDLVCRVKFTIAACILVRHLGGEVRNTAQLFSKEIENSADNVDALLDAAYSHPAFTDMNLLGCLNTPGS